MGRGLGEKERNLYMAENRRWFTAQGRELDMCAMDPNHIRNCIRLLERKRPEAYQPLVAEFQRELELRGEDMPASQEMEARFRRLADIARDLLRQYERAQGPLKARRYAKALEDIGVGYENR